MTARAVTVLGPLRSSRAISTRETLRTTTTMIASAATGTSVGISTRSRNSFISQTTSLFCHFRGTPPDPRAMLRQVPRSSVPPVAGLPVVLFLRRVPLEEQHGDDHPQQQPARRASSAARRCAGPPPPTGPTTGARRRRTGRSASRRRPGTRPARWGRPTAGRGRASGPAAPAAAARAAARPRGHHISTAETNSAAWMVKWSSSEPSVASTKAGQCVTTTRTLNEHQRRQRPGQAPHRPGTAPAAGAAPGPARPACPAAAAAARPG